MSGPLEYTIQSTSASTDSIGEQIFRSFSDAEYRHAYADEHLNTFVSHQIRAIREQHGWTQTQLGEKCGKAQAWISQLEDPNYGRFSLRTLKELARAFDCILDVRFKSFWTHSDEQNARKPGDMRVNSYHQDASQERHRSDVTETTTRSTRKAIPKPVKKKKAATRKRKAR